MKKVLEITKKARYLLLATFSLMIMAFSCEEVDNPPIKTSAYWTSPTMGVEQAKVLARHDLVIVDMENMINNLGSLKLMKALNSDLKLICYSNPMEFYNPGLSNRPLQKKFFKEVEEKYERWFLNDVNGDPVVYWPGMVMMNLSSSCYSYPLVGKYNQWIAKQLVEEVFSYDIWDGYFQDNGGGDISYVDEDMDITNDGYKSSSSYIDKSWYEGVESYLKEIRRVMGSSFILMANKGSLDFLDILDGRMFEKFPNNYLGSKKDHGWHQSMLNAKTMEKYGLRYIIFHVDPNNLTFGLTSSMLMDNVYVAVGQDNPRFNKIFETKVGKALGPYELEDDEFVRYFENGKVIVKPQYKIGEIYTSQNLAKK
ncbi:MAG: putative glycoside hydrolase [Patescibacteria group bacterium]|jgi:hypothetical protein|nr:putative glycoside hydrolase [Patescibacteria group bacterium]